MKTIFTFLLLLNCTSLFANADYGHAEQVTLSISKGSIYLDNIFVKGLKEGERITANDVRAVKVDGEVYDFRDYLRVKILEQTSYLYGILQSSELSSNLGLDSGIGIVGESHTVKSIQVEKILGKRIYFTYSYQTKALVNRDILKDGVRVIETMLPATTDENIIYNKKCTDDHYESFGDYWYFFDPLKPGCLKFLKEESRGAMTTVLFKEIKGDERVVTYPLHDKLYADNQVKAFVFFGYDGDPEIEEGATRTKLQSSVNRQKEEFSSDAGMESFSDFVTRLKRSGYRVVLENHWFSAQYDFLAEKDLPGMNHYVSLEKTVRGKMARVDVLLSNTSVSSIDMTFARYYKDAVENFELISYSGHSGLGANLDISNINQNLAVGNVKRVDFKKVPYQIFYFNGCSTYSYFNKMYFKAKGGIEKMEVITTGLQSYFSDGVDNTLAFLGSFLKFDRASYADIVDNIESTNTTGGPTLIFVNGDNDNPTTP